MYKLTLKQLKGMVSMHNESVLFMMLALFLLLLEWNLNRHNANKEGRQSLKAR